MYNFAATLERREQRFPDRLAVVDGEQRLTNRDLSRRVRSLAAGLAERGIGAGDVVALLMGNGSEFLECVLAANWLGAAFMPLNTRLAPAEWAYILEHAGASGLIADAELCTSAVPALASLAAGAPRVSVRGDGGPGWERYEALLVPEPSGPPCADVGPDAVERLMYTSGTTSRPKGVPITAANLLWKNVAHVLQFGLTYDEVTLVAGPMYHVGGLDLPATGVLYVGGRLVILRHFDALELLRTIEREQVTSLWLAPAMFNLVLQVPDLERYDTSTVRLIVGGGEKMPAAVMDRAMRAFPAAWLADCYGLTETVSGDTALDREYARTKLGSVGKPVPELHLRVVDEDDRDVAPDELGEVVVQGPKVFPGYWRDPEATAAAFRGGWFHTGDVGRLDADGFLYIEDRKKDMICSGGENIASPEVERVLYEHPGVLEAAVVAMANERWGEVPSAFVVARPDWSPDADELVAFCRERLARFKVPAAITFLDVLPRTASGKVLKRELRARAKTGEPT
ncbi:MAG: fatty-acyl-CoA synthase [Acidimicrobiaceae bacterium]|jgi:fatty-acyl-CoA synthase|nr:fatty-acyl-CoA synthase [Acidimicrobiaceae bacterium]